MVDQIWQWLQVVPDPELPMVSVVDLGIVREVREEDGRVTVAVTPTYSGCPATAVIRQDIKTALRNHGIKQVEIETRLAPAWTTAWLSQKGRETLYAAGILPPASSLVGVSPHLNCPQCGSADTECLSAFGTTPCKALYRCRACREPFEYFKPHPDPCTITD